MQILYGRQAVAFLRRARCLMVDKICRDRRRLVDKRGI